MKTTSALTIASLVALSALAAPAQAGFGPCPFGGASPEDPGRSCASAPAPACPTEASGDSCPLANSGELADTVGAMAAGGLRIAATVMRALAGEASRQLGVEPTR